MITSRRKFIKISSLGLGGVAAATSSLNLFGNNSLLDPLTSELSDGTLKKTPTYCEVCFWKCAAWAYSDSEGNIQKLIGNDEDPHCFGRLCPRGTGGLGMYNDPDRLKTPLIRVEKDGEQTFKKATWDEALTLIASKFQEIAETNGPESIALLKHGAPGKHFAHLFNAFGSNTFAEPAYAQCRGPREAGFGLTFGTWVGSPEPTDIKNTKCLVLIGSHIGENMHNSQVQELADVIDKQSTIITVDPRFSTVASKSKHWLAIKPATDMALLLSWMHVIIEEELYQKEYVKKYATGFDELKAHVQKYSPEWAYGITAIKPHIIRETAREMAHAAPAVIVHPGRHVSWYGDDTQRARAVAILNGLLGAWGNRGGFYLKEGLSLPKYPHPKYPKPKWDWQNLAAKYPLAQMGITTEVVNASIPENNPEYPVKAWLVAGTNIPKSIPNLELIEKATETLDFMVVVDTMPMDITGYADVVLPECTYLERSDGIRSAPNREPSIAVRMPATTPKYESKPAWWIAKEIGNRMGLEDYFNYETYEDVIAWQLKELGTSYEELQSIGVKKYPRKSGDLYLKPGQDYQFGTSSGKIEFYSKELKDLGFDPIPTFTKHPEPPKGFLRLNYGRAPMHTFSRTVNNPNLSALKNENDLWIHPKIAKQNNYFNGQEVWLENQDGVKSNFPIKIRITERIRWDSAFMVHGFGHANKRLSRAYGKGINDTQLVSKIAIDPIMGGTGMRGNFIKILTDNPNNTALL